MEKEEKNKNTIKNKNQMINDIGNTKFIVNLHYREGKGETYQDKIFKLIKREIEK